MMAVFDYTPQQTFLTKLDALGIDNFYRDVGNHVLAQSLAWQGAWQEGKDPNILQKSLFKKVVRRELELDFGAIDINEAAFKGKPEAFWEGPGQ